MENGIIRLNPPTSSVVTSLRQTISFKSQFHADPIVHMSLVSPESIHQQYIASVTKVNTSGFEVIVRKLGKNNKIEAKGFDLLKLELCYSAKLPNQLSGVAWVGTNYKSELEKPTYTINFPQPFSSNVPINVLVTPISNSDINFGCSVKSIIPGNHGQPGVFHVQVCRVSGNTHEWNTNLGLMWSIHTPNSKSDVIEIGDNPSGSQMVKEVIFKKPFVSLKGNYQSPERPVIYACVKHDPMNPMSSEVFDVNIKTLTSSRIVFTVNLLESKSESWYQKAKLFYVSEDLNGVYPPPNEGPQLSIPQQNQSYPQPQQFQQQNQQFHPQQHLGYNQQPSNAPPQFTQQQFQQIYPNAPPMNQQPQPQIQSYQQSGPPTFKQRGYAHDNAINQVVSQVSNSSMDINSKLQSLAIAIAQVQVKIYVDDIMVIISHFPNSQEQALRTILQSRAQLLEFEGIQQMTQLFQASPNSDDGKLKTIEQSLDPVRHRCSCREAVEVLKDLQHPSARLDALKLMQPALNDPNNFADFFTIFSSDSSRKSVKKIVKGKRFKIF